LIAILQRIGIAVQTAMFLVVPLFPSFITLTTVQIPGISLLPRPAVFALVCTITVAALAAIAFLIMRRLPAPPLARPLAALAAAGILSGALGFDPRDGAVFTAIFFSTILWYWFTMGSYDLPGVSSALWWSYVISGALASLAAVVMVVTRDPAALYTIGNGRAIGTFVLPGELAGYLIMWLPVACALTAVARARTLRVVSACAAVIGAIAMGLTFSRAGWIGLASACAIFVVVRQRRRAGVAAAIGVVGATLVAVLLVFNAHHNPSEDYTRLSIWQAAFGIINRFPLTGVGEFGFSRLYAVLRMPDGDPLAFHAHSMYLTFLAELGVLGCAAWLWVCWEFAREFVRRIREAEPAAATLALAIGAGLGGILVQGLIDTVSVVIFGLLLPTLALALSTARFGPGV
jgi:O-antigen ligase